MKLLIKNENLLSIKKLKKLAKLSLAKSKRLDFTKANFSSTNFFIFKAKKSFCFFMENLYQFVFILS